MKIFGAIYGFEFYVTLPIYKLATVVKANQKVPFSIATTPRCREGCYSFPWIAPLPLIHTLYCWVLSKEVSITISKVFGMTQLRIEPRSPGPLTNTLSTRPMSLYIRWTKVIRFWFGCVFWYINPCGLFNAKSCLYTLLSKRFRLV